MNLIQTAILSVSLACLLSCVAADGGRSLKIRSLAKGALSRIKEAKQEVIRDAAAWDKFWKQHSVSAASAEKMPVVDFSKEMVIAVTMGTKRTGGYTMEILRVEPTEKSLKIFVKETSPPPGALTIQALTAPFHFIAVPKSDLKLEFVETKRAEKN
jgi:PrcB C-terminal